MNGDNHEERIRSRAHQIWEQEGQKHGDHERHWKQALEELGGKTSGEETGGGGVAGGGGGDIAGETGRGAGDEVVVERTEADEQRRSGL